MIPLPHSPPIAPAKARNHTRIDRSHHIVAALAPEISDCRAVSTSGRLFVLAHMLTEESSSRLDIPDKATM
jgi:hypothetical protein